MFLDPDEHIIVMEDGLFNPMSTEDFKKIKSAEIKTLFVPHRIVGYDLYKHFKVLLPFFYTNNFYKEPKTFVELVNDKEEILKRAENIFFNPPRLQHIFAIPDGGEFFFDALQTDNYPLSDDQIIDFVISVQKILVKQHNEIWLCLHNFLGDPNNWNNTHLPVLYQALLDEFPSAKFYSFQFAHFMVGNVPTDPEKQKKIATYSEKYKIKFFVGSEYCEGLKKNFDRAIEQRAYGFITCPRHSINPVKHSRVEDWMIDELRETNRKFNEHYSMESYN